MVPSLPKQEDFCHVLVKKIREFIKNKVNHLQIQIARFSLLLIKVQTFVESINHC